MYKKLIIIVLMMTICGCSSSLMFISSNQPDQLKDLNHEIKNANAIIEQNNGDEINAKIIKVTADSVFYINTEENSFPTSKVSSIRVGTKARGFYLIGIALTGYGVYQLSNVESEPSLAEGLGKLYGGLGSIVLGVGALTLGYYDFERTYYIN
jgi:hypothetical protein